MENSQRVISNWKNSQPLRDGNENLSNRECP